MAKIQFDATKHTPKMGSGDFHEWTDGPHLGIIFASEIKNAASGKGKVAHFTLKAMDGPDKNETLLHTITFLHENEKTQAIGQQELSLLCYCCGKLKIEEDTAELHGIPFMFDVKVSKQCHKDDKNKPVAEQRTVTFNNVTAMFKADGTLPVAGSIAPGASAPPPAFVTQPQAPVAAPAPAPPAPPVQTPPDTRMFFVSHAGKNLNPMAPVNAEGVRNYGLPLDQIQVCVVEGSNVGPWTPGTVAFAATPVPAPTQVAPAPLANNIPPWNLPKKE